MSLAFSQPATGPSSVCEGNDVILKCVIISTANNKTTPISSIWTISPDRKLAIDLPNHRVMLNSSTDVFNNLVITDVRLEDDNTTYNCGDLDNTISSSVVLNVTGNNMYEMSVIQYFGLHNIMIIVFASVSKVYTY